MDPAALADPEIREVVIGYAELCQELQERKKKIHGGKANPTREESRAYAEWKRDVFRPARVAYKRLRDEGIV